MRVLSPPPVERSPLLAGSHGSQCRFVVLEVALADFKAAGKAAGGSVNDAFLAALLGGFRRYHEHFGVQVDFMPMALPISLRTADDPAGGNRFAGARFAGPVGEPDPRERIQAIREFVLSARAEPAIGVLEMLAPAVSRLPAFVLVGLTASVTSVSDFQASNIPGLGHTAYAHCEMGVGRGRRTVVVRCEEMAAPRVGAQVGVVPDPREIHVFDGESGLRRSGRPFR